MLSYKKTKISSLELTVFYRQLATLIQAGVPLVQSLAILLQSQEQQPALNKLIYLLKSEIERGKPLAKVLEKHPGYFDPLTAHLIHIAEQTGSLDNMLTRIANNKEKSLQLKHKILQALLYPSIILVTAFIITLTLLTFIIPRFADLFASFHATLPALTRSIIYLSSRLHRYCGWLVIPVVISGLLPFCYKKFFRFKIIIDKFFLQSPLLGNFAKKLLCARYARLLATVFAAGMPITQALKMLVPISHNHIVVAALQKLQIEIAAGQHLYQAMQHCRLFPAMMIQMVKVGEETGALEQMLAKTAEFYEADIDYWVHNFSYLLEPLIIMVLGVLIGTLVIAMYLPIFKLGMVI